MKKYGFGVDIGGTTCKIGLFETAGNLVEKWEIPTVTKEEGKNILPDIANSLKGKMAERGISMEDLEGIGVGLPGPVRSDGIVPVCVNLGWKNKDVAKELKELMDGISVKAGNDANVAALGEMWQGGGKGCSNVVMVTLGTGVGGGIIVNGKIVTTEARAKEVRKEVEHLIALAVKERDNFETVTVKAKVARKDKDGKRVKEVVDGKKVTIFDEVDKTIKKDMPSRLHARRQILQVLYPASSVGKRKKDKKEIDLVAKLFDEIAPKYADRNGGYTRIVKIGQRKGDGAMEVLIELV